MHVHDKLEREWAELEQWRSNFKAAVQRTAREPMPLCTRHRKRLLARLDSYPRRSWACSPSRTGCERRRARRKRAAGSSERKRAERGGGLGLPRRRGGQKGRKIRGNALKDDEQCRAMDNDREDEDGQWESCALDRLAEAGKKVKELEAAAVSLQGAIAAFEVEAANEVPGGVDEGFFLAALKETFNTAGISVQSYWNTTSVGPDCRTLLARYPANLAFVRAAIAEKCGETEDADFVERHSRVLAPLALVSSGRGGSWGICQTGCRTTARKQSSRARARPSGWRGRRATNAS
jgi:hypothetical protein